MPFTGTSGRRSGWRRGTQQREQSAGQNGLLLVSPGYGGTRSLMALRPSNRTHLGSCGFAFKEGFQHGELTIYKAGSTNEPSKEGPASVTHRVRSASRFWMGSDSKSATQSSPESVAIAYVKALYSSTPADAGQFVLPSDRPFFKIMEGIIAKTNKIGSTRDLAAGSVTATGNSAEVIFTGSLCGTDSVQVSTTTASHPICVTNTDPKSTKFLVKLKRVGNEWFVYLPHPSQPPTTTTSP
jgi:hypothetical protein